MLRFTRPLLQVSKLTTGIHGIKVHPDPLPALTQIYQDTLTKLANLPEHSVYRQGSEALVRHRLSVIQNAAGDISQVEKELDEGQIEESLMIANDELQLVDKMVEWKSWEPLEEKPEPGQWEYFGKTSEATA